MRDEQLIELVKRYPILYNTNLAQYRDHTVRNNAWEEIAGEMDTPGKFYYEYYLLQNRIYLFFT